MKIDFRNCSFIPLLLPWLFIAIDAGAQVKSVYSSNAAFSVLNAGPASTAPSTTYIGNTVSNTSAAVKAITPSLGYLGPLNSRWNISFGIPVQVVFDYGFVRGRMVDAYEENPDLYNNGTPEFKQAVDFLGWTEFSPISDWAPVKCTVKFRFIPPVLGDNYDFKYDYRNNPSAAPEKGTVTFWIR